MTAKAAKLRKRVVVRIVIYCCCGVKICYGEGVHMTAQCDSVDGKIVGYKLKPLCHVFIFTRECYGRDAFDQKSRLH